MSKNLLALSFAELCQIPPKQLHEYALETSGPSDNSSKECLAVAHALVYLSQNYQVDEPWHKAHELVQNAFSQVDSQAEQCAHWTHALLHKIEGDLGNARYWYSRCRKKDQFDTRYAAEAEAIWQELSQLAQSGL